MSVTNTQIQKRSHTEDGELTIAECTAVILVTTGCESEELIKRLTGLTLTDARELLNRPCVAEVVRGFQANWIKAQR